MKLADRIAQSLERSLTTEQINNLRTEGNPNPVFNILTSNFFNKEYGMEAFQIMEAVKENCKGFVVEIAERFSSPSNRYEMSEKQAWCLAFAFIKIENELN